MRVILFLILSSFWYGNASLAAGVSSVSNCGQLYKNLGLKASQALSDNPSRTYVNSVDDFYLHMYGHAKNVKLLSEDIFDQIKANPSKWKSVFYIPEETPIDNHLKDLLAEFISLHDSSKINIGKEFLKKVRRKKLIIYELYSIYGKSFKDLNSREQKIVEILNKIDKNVLNSFVKSHELKDWEIKFLTEVEKLADGAERGINPVTAEEMAKKTWKESQGIYDSIIIAKNNNTSINEVERLNRKLEMAKTIEEDYPKIALVFSNYRQKTNDFKLKFNQAGIDLNSLDEFSIYYLIDVFEKNHGKTSSLDDPKLIKNLKNFFFKDNIGKEALQASMLKH